jgi:Helix-turn-helix domain
MCHAAQRGVTIGAHMTQTELLTAKECADYRRCSLRTLDRERELGNGCPYVRIGGRIYYRRRDVDQFIAAHLCGGSGDRERAAA